MSEQFELDDLFPDDDIAERIGRHRRKEDEPVETTPTLPYIDPDHETVELPEDPVPAKPSEPTPQQLIERAAARARQAETLPEPGPVPHLPSPSLPGAREVTYSQPMDLAQPEPGAKGPWIQYNGVATVRIITRHDWAQAGVPSDKYCEWNYMNAKRLPRSMFTDEELQYLLRVDGRFSLEK